MIDKYILKCNKCGKTYISDNKDKKCGYCLLKKLEDIIKIQTNALGYYADDNNYDYVDKMPYGSEYTFVDVDHGDIAKKAIVESNDIMDK
jgi:hypothetical protein